MTDYVRIDTEDSYIYFENDTDCGNFLISEELQRGEERRYRSKYTLNTSWRCIRMTRKRNIPKDKKCNKWYQKEKRK